MSTISLSKIKEGSSLFSPFFCLFDPNLNTGIGLYIVKCTVEEYDGDVFVEDNKPQGAVFVIRLKRTIER